MEYYLLITDTPVTIIYILKALVEKLICMIIQKVFNIF